MAQPNNGTHETSTPIHAQLKITDEENQEDHPVYKNTGANPTRGGTNGENGDTLQPILQQDHQSPTKDSDGLHRPVPDHIQQGKQIIVFPLEVRQK